MVLVYYLIQLGVQSVVCCGFAYRFFQTKVRYYGALALALVLNLIVDVLLGFFANVGELTAWVVYLSIDLQLLSNLIFVMVVVLLFLDWLGAMKKQRGRAWQIALSITQALKFSYPLIFLILIICFYLLLVAVVVAGAIVVGVALLYTIAVVVQISLMMWLWLSLQKSLFNDDEQYQQQREKEGEITLNKKRNQLVRLLTLTILSAWPALLDGVASGIGVAVCWWLWYGIALWPGALVGYDLPPLEERDEAEEIE